MKTIVYIDGFNFYYGFCKTPNPAPFPGSFPGRLGEGPIVHTQLIFKMKIAEAGCDVADGVTKDTTILVVGCQDDIKLAGCV